MSNKLNTKFCGVYFKNPIVVASTDIGRTAEGFERFAKTGVGGIITKSVTDAAPPAEQRNHNVRRSQHG